MKDRRFEPTDFVHFPICSEVIRRSNIDPVSFFVAKENLQLKTFRVRSTSCFVRESEFVNSSFVQKKKLRRLATTFKRRRTRRQVRFVSLIFLSERRKIFFRLEEETIHSNCFDNKLRVEEVAVRLEAEHCLDDSKFVQRDFFG